QIATALGIPLSEAYGVATYYKMIYTEPVGRKVVRVCDDVSCYLAGSQDILHVLRNVLWVGENGTTADGEYTLEVAPCLGHCDCAPIVQVGDAVHEFVRAPEASKLLVAAE